MAEPAGAEQAVHAEREASFLLALPEKRLLRWLAARLPRWILPDDMTAIGVLAAIGVAVAYQLSNESLTWLWVASGLLMLLSVGTLIVVAYLILSINVYLESFAFNRFSIGYGHIGPTEIRLVLIALNTALALDLGLDFRLAGLDLTVFDVVGLAIASVMIVLLAGRSFVNLRELARREPAAPRR